MQNEFNNANPNDLLSSLEIGSAEIPQNSLQESKSYGAMENVSSPDNFIDPLAVFETEISYTSPTSISTSQHKTDSVSGVNDRIKSSLKFLSHYLAVS